MEEAPIVIPFYHGDLSNFLLPTLGACFASSRAVARLSRALDSAEDNCMLIPINGHFVVERLSERHSFARLSVPPNKDISIALLPFPVSSQPKTCKATKVANSSADVDAHWAPIPGLNRYGTSVNPSFKENHLFVLNSHPANTTQVSVHLASVRN